MQDSAYYHPFLQSWNKLQNKLLVSVSIVRDFVKLVYLQVMFLHSDFILDILISFVKIF